jgi:hypothetical protein
VDSVWVYCNNRVGKKLKKSACDEKEEKDTQIKQSNQQNLIVFFQKKGFNVE